MLRTGKHPISLLGNFNCTTTTAILRIVRISNFNGSSCVTKIEKKVQKPSCKDMPLLPRTKHEVNVFARACLSVCLSARLLKNACMDLDEMLRVDRCRDMDELINFCFL